MAAGSFNIGKLVVSIAANTGQLQQGLKAAETQTQTFGKSFSLVGSQLAAAGAKMKTALLGIGAALAGALSVRALSSMLSATEKTGDGFQKMSIRLGMSTEALSELGFAAERSGTNIEALETSFRTATKNMVEFARTGKGEATLAIEMLGGGFASAIKAGASLETLLPEISKAFKRLSETDRVFVASKLFGRSGTSIIPLLTDNLGALRERARELGLTWTRDGADKAAAYDDALTDLKSSFVGLRNALVLPALPTLTKVLDTFTDAVSAARPKVDELAESAKKLPQFDAGAMTLRLADIDSALKTLQESYDQTLKVTSGPIGEGIDPSITNAKLERIKAKMAELRQEAVNLRAQMLFLGPRDYRKKNTEDYNAAPMVNPESLNAKGGPGTFNKITAGINKAVEAGNRWLHFNVADKNSPKGAGAEMVAGWQRTGDQIDAFIQKLGTAKEEMRGFSDVIRDYIEQVGTWQASAAELIVNTWQNLSQGIGDAVAGAIIYGEDLGEAMLNVMKQVAAGIISMLIQIGLQQIAAAILGQTILATETSAKLSAYGATTAAGAYASSIPYFTAAFTPFAAPALAAAYAAQSVVGMTTAAAGGAAAGSAAGGLIGALGAVPAMAAGGIVRSPTLALIGEAGPEAVVPLKNNEHFGNLHLTLEMDGRKISDAVIRNMPGRVRLRLGNRL